MQTKITNYFNKFNTNNSDIKTDKIDESLSRV